MKKQVKTLTNFQAKETTQVVTITKLETVKGGSGRTTKLAGGSPTGIQEF